MSNPVLCKDCKHSFRSIREVLFGYAPMRCHKIYTPAGVKVDPVYGPKKFKGFYADCLVERSWNGDNQCGKEGRLWEPRENRHFFTYLKRI